jgi:hypothetical protein
MKRGWTHIKRFSGISRYIQERATSVSGIEEVDSAFGKRKRNDCDGGENQSSNERE